MTYFRLAVGAGASPVVADGIAVTLKPNMATAKNKSKQGTELAAEHAAEAAKRFTQMVELVAARVGAQCHADAVFGTPITRDGVTVIPVVQAVGGFGAGAGAGAGDKSTPDADGGGGLGSGGGFIVNPVGVLELRADGARFRRVQPPGAWSIIATLLTLAYRRLERRTT